MGPWEKGGEKEVLRQVCGVRECTFHCTVSWLSMLMTKPVIDASIVYSSEPNALLKNTESLSDARNRGWKILLQITHLQALTSRLTCRWSLTSGIGRFATTYRLSNSLDTLPHMRLLL